jgi:hypothetical protein
MPAIVIVIAIQDSTSSRLLPMRHSHTTTETIAQQERTYGSQTTWQAPNVTMPTLQVLHTIAVWYDHQSSSKWKGDTSTHSKIAALVRKNVWSTEMHE